MPPTSPSDITFTFFAFIFSYEHQRNQFQPRLTNRERLFSQYKVTLSAYLKSLLLIVLLPWKVRLWLAQWTRTVHVLLTCLKKRQRHGRKRWTKIREESLSRKVNLSACCTFHRGPDNSNAKSECSSSYARIRVTCPNYIMLYGFWNSRVFFLSSTC